MTPEQSALANSVTRLMQLGGKLFFVFWIVTCGATAVIALFEMLGVRTPGTSSGPPLLWCGVLIGSIAAAGSGALFIRFWLDVLGRFRSQIQDASNVKGSRGQNFPAGREHGGGITTTVHIGLQFVLMVIGCLVALVIYVCVLRGLAVPPLVSGIMFIAIMGIGGAVPKFAMRFVPARCPSRDRAAFCRGGRPITFVCGTCGRIHNTGVSIESRSDDS